MLSRNDHKNHDTRLCDDGSFYGWHGLLRFLLVLGVAAKAKTCVHSA